MNDNTTILKYSIIVPVYNVEKYLAECVDSLLAQDTEDSYEIILVDDGSQDISGELVVSVLQEMPEWNRLWELIYCL